jgi:hypothetical protein
MWNEQTIRDVFFPAFVEFCVRYLPRGVTVSEILGAAYPAYSSRRGDVPTPASLRPAMEKCFSNPDTRGPNGVSGELGAALSLLRKQGLVEPTLRGHWRPCEK